jgi:hypothetical protein
LQVLLTADKAKPIMAAGKTTREGNPMQDNQVVTVEEISEANAPAIYVKGGLQQFLDAVKAEVVAEVPDLTTKKGRDRIASLASKVSKSKVAVEKPGREYLARLKEMPKVVEAELREFVRAMDVLRDDTRKPLTEWEEREQQRIDRIKSQVARLGDTDTADMSSADILQSIESLEAHVIDAQYEEFDSEAHRVKSASLAALRDALAKQQQYESEQAELSRLRQEQAEREAQAERDRIAKEAAERATREAEEKAKAEREAAEQRERDAKLAAERRELELQLQAEEAKRQAAEAERKQAEAEHKAAQDKIDAERRQAEAVARAEAAERQRAADEQAEAERQAKAREADRKHKSAVMGAAKEAIMLAGITEDQAREVVKLIAAGKVPHTTISF